MIEKEKNKEVMFTKPLKLSLKERKVLYLLRLNCRMPVSEIAKKIGSSRELTQYTLKKLIEKKIISRFFSLVDYNRLGYERYYLLIKFKNNVSNKSDEFINSIKKIEGVRRIYHFFRSFDILIEIACPNINEVDKIFFEIKNLTKDVLTKYYSLRILKKVYCPTKFLLSDSEIKTLNVNSEITKRIKDKQHIISEREKIILKELYESPRISITELSNKSKFSYNKTKNLLESLIKNKIILGFMTSFNFSLKRFAGLNSFEVFLRFNEDKKHSRKAFEEFLENHKYVSSYIRFTASVYDYLVWIYAPHINDLNDMLSKISSAFPDNLEIF